MTDEGKFCVDWTNYRWIDSCVAVVRDGDSVTFKDDGGRIVSFGESRRATPTTCKRQRSGMKVSRYATPGGWSI